MQRYVGPVIVGGALGAIATYLTNWMRTPDNVVKFRKREPHRFLSLEQLHSADEVARCLLIIRSYTVTSTSNDGTNDASSSSSQTTQQQQECWEHLLEYLHSMTVLWTMRNSASVDINELSLQILADKALAATNLRCIYNLAPQKTEELEGAWEYIELLLHQLEHDVVFMKETGDDDPHGRRSR